MRVGWGSEPQPDSGWFDGQFRESSHSDFCRVSDGSSQVRRKCRQSSGSGRAAISLVTALRIPCFVIRVFTENFFAFAVAAYVFRVGLAGYERAGPLFGSTEFSPMSSV